MMNIQLFGGGGGSSGLRGFHEVTHPNARMRGHREYKNDDLNIKFRKDPPVKNFPEHWHVENPQKTGNSDMYLDKYGNPCPRHSPQAALTFEDFINLLKILRSRKK